mgnify:CR=1 FL=1
MKFELHGSTFHSDKEFQRGDAVKYVGMVKGLELLRGIVVGHNGKGVEVYWSSRNEVQTEIPDFIEKVKQ